MNLDIICALASVQADWIHMHEMNNYHDAIVCALPAYTRQRCNNWLIDFVVFGVCFVTFTL